MHWILWAVIIIGIFYLLSVISVMILFKSATNTIDKTVSNIQRGF